MEWVIKNSNVVGKALIDHIIAKGLGIKDLKYSWDFVSEKNGYGNLKPEDYKSHLVGLPDHAILSATVELED